MPSGTSFRQRVDSYLKWSLLFIFTAGVPLPVVGVVPLAGLLRGVLAGVPGTQGLVLMGTQHAVWLPAHIW